MDLFLLFTVEDAFQISGRGCVLVPGLRPTPGMPAVRVGDAILLIKPDGDSIETTVQGIEMINYGRRKPPAVVDIPILLPSPITKQDVAPGTKVHYVGPRPAR